MKKIFFLVLGVGILVGVPFVAMAAAYRSLNEMCIVEKKGNNYWFLNEKELAAKANQVFETNRNQFEWFFAENGKVVAKVYPALRDAVIQTPDELYMQDVDSCERTDTNQRSAVRVSFKYRSKDNVCACLLEQKGINCAINEQQLGDTPYNQWVLFFETAGYPAVISGIVPPVLSKAWIDLPDDYIQTITPCSNSTANQEMAKRLEPQVRHFKHK